MESMAYNRGNTEGKITGFSVRIILDSAVNRDMNRGCEKNMTEYRGPFDWKLNYTDIQSSQSHYFIIIVNRTGK